MPTIHLLAKLCQEVKRRAGMDAQRGGRRGFQRFSPLHFESAQARTALIVPVNRPHRRMVHQAAPESSDFPGNHIHHRLSRSLTLLVCNLVSSYSVDLRHRKG